MECDAGFSSVDREGGQGEALCEGDEVVFLVLVVRVLVRARRAELQQVWR